MLMFDEKQTAIFCTKNASCSEDTLPEVPRVGNPVLAVVL
jgi:hypothetical protein